jgi:hypothetical protein
MLFVVQQACPAHEAWSKDVKVKVIVGGKRAGNKIHLALVGPVHAGLPVHLPPGDVSFWPGLRCSLLKKLALGDKWKDGTPSKVLGD